jgi:excisionase family DNA binding protein
VTGTLQHGSSQDRSMKVSEVAQELSVSPATVHKYIQNGTLRAANVGTGRKAYWRVQRADFEAFLTALQTRTTDHYGAAS